MLFLVISNFAAKKWGQKHPAKNLVVLSFWYIFNACKTFGLVKISLLHIQYISVDHFDMYSNEQKVYFVQQYVKTMNF